VVWETLRPGWEVFSRETEGETFPFHFSPRQTEMIFNNVLFTPNSEGMKMRSGGAGKERGRS